MKHYLILFLCLLAAPLSTFAHTYLQVVCEPGVQIFLDDTFKGTTNWADGGLNIKVSPGSYEVKALKEGFTPQETKISLRKSDVEVWTLKTFTAQKGEAKTATATSTDKAYGSLTIYSYPEQCKITLVTPSQSHASWPKNMGKWTAQKIPAGKYTVKATALGKTLSYDVSIPPSGGAVLYFDFRRDSASLRDLY